MKGDHVPAMGYHHTDEARAKISDANRQRAERGDYRRLAETGEYHTPEGRARIGDAAREARLHDWQTEEGRARLGTWTDERRAKLSESMRAYWAGQREERAAQ